MLSSKLFQSTSAIAAGGVRLSVRQSIALRSLSVSSLNQYASHAHGHAVKPTETLLEAINKRYPGNDDATAKRLEQLKKNHMKILSLDINWNVLKPEEREESLRELEKLIKSGYSSLSAEQKKAVSMQNVYSTDHGNISAWDAILSKNDELQAGDWRNMTLEEKKAAHYLAWGPLPESNSEYRTAIAIRTLIVLGIAYGIYSGLYSYFRSKKDLPSLTPEWKEKVKERMIHERMNPYTGVSADLFTKEGIKEQ